MISIRKLRDTQALSCANLQYRQATSRCSQGSCVARCAGRPRRDTWISLSQRVRRMKKPTTLLRALSYQTGLAYEWYVTVWYDLRPARITVRVYQ